MRRLDQELFDEFKRVDAICRDMFSSQRGVSEYIEQMEQAFADGRRQVPSWERDYRALKRVRWLRNQIAHEMTETDCAADDVRYLQDFHDRLLHRQDPLAALSRARRIARPAASRRPAPPRRAAVYSRRAPARRWKRRFWGVAVVVIGLLAVLLLFYFQGGIQRMLPGFFP